MLQRRLVVLPPLLAAVLATVAGVGRDSSDYGGEYGPASRPICPPFPSSSTYLTLRTQLRAGTYVLSSEPACARLPVALSQCGDASCCVSQGRIVSEIEPDRLRLLKNHDYKYLAVFDPMTSNRLLSQKVIYLEVIDYW